MDYVVGFMFNVQRDAVLLIRKKRPAWQDGLLNGIGGKIEENEPPICAMIREFEEEVGIKTTFKDWQLLCAYECLTGAMVYFYVAVGNINDAQSVTDEVIELVPTNSICYQRCIDNLKWLVPMAYFHDVQPVNFKEKYR